MGSETLTLKMPQAKARILPLMAYLRLIRSAAEGQGLYRAVEPSSGSNVIPRRARPGLAGLGPHKGVARLSSHLVGHIFTH